jgi:hypothetical protein
MIEVASIKRLVSRDVQIRYSAPQAICICVGLFAQDIDERPRFFVLSGVETMEKRAEYRAHTESTSGRYGDDLGRMNWKTAFCFQDRWNILPRYQGASS